MWWDQGTLDEQLARGHKGAWTKNNMHRSAMFTKMSSSTRISNWMPECYSFFGTELKNTGLRKCNVKTKGRQFCKVFRADWQSKRVCWGKHLEKFSLPEKEGDCSSQQVTTNHWKSVLTRVFHLPTWLPICRFTCHRLNLHPFFSLPQWSFTAVRGATQNNSEEIFPWFTFPVWDASLSWKSIFEHLTTRKEGEVKKEKIKRKKGGKRSKEVRSGRNLKRHTGMIVMDSKDRWSKGQVGGSNENQWNPERAKRIKEWGERKQFFKKSSVSLKNECKIVTRVLT